MTTATVARPQPDVASTRNRSAAGPDDLDTQSTTRVVQLVPSSNHAAATHQTPNPTVVPTTSAIRPAPATALRPKQPPVPVWIVAIGLFALAILIARPIAEPTPSLVSAVLTENEFGRAFAALILQYVVVLWACAVALVVLAVGLLRGSRVAQLLTCGLGLVVAVAQAAALSSPRAGAAPDETSGAVTIAVALGVVLVLIAAPATRLFFAGDPRPVGVPLAASTNVFFGAVSLVDAILLCLAGVAGTAYVWIGLAFGVVGAVLIASSRGLRAGRTAARAATVAVYTVVAIAVLWLGAEREQIATPGTLVPLGVVIIGGASLLLPESSRQHFVRNASGIGPSGASGELHSCGPITPRGSR